MHTGWADKCGLLCKVCGRRRYFGMHWRGTQIYIYIYKKKVWHYLLLEKKKRKKMHPVFLDVSDVFVKHFRGKLCFLPWEGAGVCGGVVVVVGGCSGSAAAGCEKSTQALYASDSDQFRSWGGENLCPNEPRGSSLGKEQVQRSGGQERKGITSLGGGEGGE